MTWEPPEMETLQDTARLAHEVYKSMLREGFNEHQALHIALGNACCELTYREEDE